MNDNKFDIHYSKKSISELTSSLLNHRITGAYLDPIWYDALLAHFEKRELTDHQKARIEHILNTDPEMLKNELSGTSEIQNEKTTVKSITKYPALLSISGIIAFIAYVIALLTLVIVFILISNLGESSWFMSVVTFATGTVSFISLLAYSEIIKVVIDIEENTREAAKK